MRRLRIRSKLFAIAQETRPDIRTTKFLRFCCSLTSRSILNLILILEALKHELPEASSWKSISITEVENRVSYRGKIAAIYEVVSDYDYLCRVCTSISYYIAIDQFAKFYNLELSRVCKALDLLIRAFESNDKHVEFILSSHKESTDGYICVSTSTWMNLFFSPEDQAAKLKLLITPPISCVGIDFEFGSLYFDKDH